MQRTHRTRIGSVSKAIVSGPATYQAMQENGFDPEFKKVYGADGIFGEYFRDLCFRHRSVILEPCSPVRCLPVP